MEDNSLQFLLDLKHFESGCFPEFQWHLMIFLVLLLIDEKLCLGGGLYKDLYSSLYRELQFRRKIQGKIPMPN